MYIRLRHYLDGRALDACTSYDRALFIHTVNFYAVKAELLNSYRDKIRKRRLANASE